MAYREFEDERGVGWKVWDTYPEATQRVGMVGLTGGWLAFESDRERRRLVPAPVGWADSSDERLRRWLATASPVTLRVEPFLEASEPVPVADRAESARRGRAYRLDRVNEDARAQIKRSRETLEGVIRAIERGSDAVEEPQA